MVVTVLQETRYRQRYLDGIVNHDHVRNIFVTRARIVQYVRKYLDDRQFLEVMLCWLPPTCTESALLCQAFTVSSAAPLSQAPLDLSCSNCHPMHTDQAPNSLIHQKPPPLFWTVIIACYHYCITLP